MANQRISQFTYTSTITGDELIGVAINGQNKSISVGQILAAADESCKNAEQDKRIDNNYKAIVQQEILVRETSEKMSALQITVDDLYKQIGENNDEISSYISSVCENISSYFKQIQSNTDLISYFHADVMRLDAAISSIKDTLYKKNGMQDVLNQHTEQLVILHDELHDLEQEVAYNLDSANSVSSYLESYVYPVINDISTKVENLIEQGDEHTNQISELQSSYSNLLQSVSDINTNLNNKIDTAYAGMSLALIQESTKITAETDAKLTVLRAEINTEKEAVHKQLDEHTAYIKDIISVNNAQSTYITNNRKDFDDAYSYIKTTIENVAYDLSYSSNSGLDAINKKLDLSYAYALEYTSSYGHTLNNKIDSNHSYALDYTSSYGYFLNDKINSTYAYALDYTSSYGHTLNNKIDSNHSYALDYTSSYGYFLNDKINSTYAYALGYISNSYESLYNDIVATYSYVESSYNNVYAPLVDNIARIDSKLTELSDYDIENTNKIKDLTYTSSYALSLAKENTNHISKLESDYVTIDNRLDTLEADSISIHQTLAYQSDAIHILHDNVNTIENITIPNLEQKLENADNVINERIDKIVELIGAANIDDSNKLTYNDIQHIADTVLGRILELEDETAHMAYHESHPETSIWGEWQIVSGCGYKSDSCISAG